MARIIDLPEVPQPEPPREAKLDMPKRDRATTGCAVVIALWCVLVGVFITALLIRAVFWAVGI